MSKTRPELEIEFRDKLRATQSQWLRLWDDAAAFCCPDRRQIIQSSLVSKETAFLPRPQVENSIAKDCVIGLAGGCKQWIIPGAQAGWWQWQPQPGVADTEAVKAWLADCTMRAESPLEAGGFYSAGHETFKDLGVFGTAGMTIMEGERQVLRCQSLAPSEFVFQTDFDGGVSRAILTYHKTSSELLQLFGRAKLPPAVIRDLDTNQGNERHEVMHSVHRREEKSDEQYPDDPMSKPFASMWIHVASKKEMGEGGFDEMPLIVPRWDKWSNSSDYGVSPAMAAIADIRGVNVFDMIMGVLAELQVDPRIKRGPTETGAIDLSPGGVTQENEKDGVREWATQGRFDIGLKMLERKEAQIRRIFHADLFESLIGVDREITKYEAQLREQQSMNRIAPAMARFDSDFVNPAMRRVFMILYRQGHFASPPAEAFYTDGIGRRFLIFPKTVQTNRMSRAMNSRRGYAFQKAMERVIPLSAARPELLDGYNFPVILRDLDRGDGLPEEWRNDEDTIAAIAAARAQAQQQQQLLSAGLEAATKNPEAVAGMLGGAQAA